MRGILKKVFIIAVFTWYLFPVYFVILPELCWTFIYYFIVVFYLICHCKLVRTMGRTLYPYKNYLYVFFIVYGSAVVWSIMVAIWNNSNDFNYFLYLVYILRGMICYVFLLVFLYNISGPENLYEKFCLAHIYSVCFYVISTSVMIFFPDFKNMWIDIIYLSMLNEDLMHVSNYITRVGLSGFSGFYHTYLCTISVILCLHLFSKVECKISALKIITLLILLLLGNFYYGRSGAILSILCVGTTFISFYSIKYLKNLLALFVAIISLSFCIYMMEDAVPEVALWLSWVLDPVNQLINSIGTGSISIGYSGDSMFENMYFIPENDATILFGDGRYGDENSYYMDTDVGIMRAMLFYGVIGAFLGYSSLCILLYLLFAICKKSKDKAGKLMVGMLSMQFLFFELKGDPYKFLFGIVFVAILANLHEREELRKNNG